MEVLAQSGGPAPAEFGWWLASRASGIVALLCIAVSVGLGLAMAGKVAARPLGPALLALHQHTALAGLVAIAVHGITLLGDGFLSPSLGDIAIPFTSTFAPVWVGLGVTGGWLAAILGLTYYARDRIGPRRWRSLHRATILVYVLAVAHTLGAGTDASEPWMVAILALTGAPILFLFVLRVMTPRPPAAWRRYRVVAVRPESADVTSLTLEPADRKPAPAFAPGQFLPVRTPAGTRTYSLSAPDRVRISVKRDGAVSTWLHEHVRPGDVLEAGAPAGAFSPAPGDGPLVLLSAGIGVTPVLAMLAALAAERSRRPVWWVHAARSPEEHAFAGEAAGHLARLPNARSLVRYSARDGRLAAGDIIDLGVPRDADVRLCGTPAFVTDMTAGLVAHGVPADRIASEAFGGKIAPRTPDPDGLPDREKTRVLPANRTDRELTGVTFARSAVATTWDEDFASLLELAEAHAVPSGASCRVGACHGCSARVITGEVRHDPEPVAPPPAGRALLCCARPAGGELVLDV
jgi:ferredoxin-NADP reductase